MSPDSFPSADAAQAARADKDAKRADIEALLRPLIDRILATPEVTDEQRRALGLPVRCERDAHGREK